MEGGYRLTCFFFRDPVEGYGQLARLIRGRFKELFEDGGAGGRDTYKESAFQAVIRSAEVRFLISVRIRSEYGLEAYKLNLYEYYLLLEQMDKMRQSGRNSRH